MCLTQIARELLLVILSLLYICLDGIEKASAATLLAAPAWTEEVIFGPGRLHGKRP